MVVDDILRDNEEEWILQKILEEGGTDADLLLIKDVIQFVMDKNVCGATGAELKVISINHFKRTFLVRCSERLKRSPK